MKSAYFTLAVFLIIGFIPHLSAQTLPYQDSLLSVDQRVNDLMGRMSLDEKIGQMMQPDLGVVGGNPSILTTYNIGSMLSGGSSDPATGNTATDWANMYDAMQTYALNTQLKIPMIYGIDAVHGHNNVYGATIFPHNIGLGCTRNPELVKEAARITAIEIAATGIDWTFAPCIAVPCNERWGRTYEGFGETPELAQLLGSAAIRGFQGDSLSEPTSILACAKHFLGDGGTTGGIDRGNTELNEAALRSIHLPGYISAIDSGVGSIMVSYSSINGFKMHANKYWITDVLKGELGFKGIVVSDMSGIDQITNNYQVCVQTSINAGIDMVMQPAGCDNFLNIMRNLISAGIVDTARVDDAVRRILTVKFKLGLFERPFADKTLLPLVGCDAHRAVARQCVRESMVLLKKKDGIVPLRKNARILVAGSNADNVGNQCGGWTISWQGGSGNPTTGTTILQGMRKIAPGAQIEYSETGDFTNTSADYSVVVVGETPYAEAGGDRIDLSLSEGLIQKMKSYGAPVIVIIVSGRPLIIERILHFADVIFAAWLPGTEGDGVADVLFGDYQPKGHLSHTWPKSMAQIPINVGDAGYYPLYEYGFGIDSFADSPVGSAPVCLSAIITNDAKHFELTFNKRMNDPYSSLVTVTITRNHLPLTAAIKPSLKANDNTTLVIELDSTYFTKFDVGAVSYDAGNIESADGGRLQPFGPIDAYNWIKPAAVTIPVRIEAENCSDMFGVQLEPTTDIDGVSDVVSIDNGDWLEYTINVSASNNYYVFFRIASESAASVLISYGGKNTSKSLPTTGSWQTWRTTTSTKIALTAGEQTLRIRAITGGFHLNWIYIGTSSTAVEEQSLLPLVYKLDQNYPNPFNPETVISYRLPFFSHVELKIFDMLGKEIATLVDKEQKAGRYEVKFNGSNLSSGIYIYQIRAGIFIEKRKMILLK